MSCPDRNPLDLFIGNRTNFKMKLNSAEIRDANIPYRETTGMPYFARVLDKIRKHARGTLKQDFHADLGRGLDRRCFNYLRVNYADLSKRTLEDGSAVELLRRCFDSGRKLSEDDILIWNEFL